MRCEAVHDLLHGCMSGRRSSWCLLQHRGAGALPGGLRLMFEVCACAGVAHVRQTRQTRAAHGRSKRLSKLRRFGVAALPAAFAAYGRTLQPGSLSACFCPTCNHTVRALSPCQAKVQKA